MEWAAAAGHCTWAYIGLPTLADYFPQLVPPPGAHTLHQGRAGRSDHTPTHTACCTQANEDSSLSFYCGEGGGTSSGLPSMLMYFHKRISETVLWRGWVPRSEGEQERAEEVCGASVCCCSTPSRGHIQPMTEKGAALADAFQHPHACCHVCAHKQWLAWPPAAALYNL